MTDRIESAMVNQVKSLPELIRQQYADLEPKARTVLSTPEIFNIQHIILCGLGDSFAACTIMKPVFERLTGKRTEAVNALELSRYYESKFFGGAPQDPLVIAVSNSGKVARLSEAVQRVRKHGGFVLGITGNETAPLAENSDRILKLDIPSFASAPGTRSFCVSEMALLLLAIRIGEVRGKYTMDKAKSMRKDILAQADAFEKILPMMDDKMYEMAQKWSNFHHFDFVGAGPDYSTAWFGKAKVFEALGDFAVDVNMEEWLHLNFFMKDISSIATIMICRSSNPALSRCLETINYASQLGRPMLIVSDKQKDFFGIDCDYVQSSVSEYDQTMSLTQFAPLCLLFGYLMAMRNERGGRGCEGPWKIAEGAACVRNSEMVIID